MTLNAAPPSSGALCKVSNSSGVIRRRRVQTLARVNSLKERSERRYASPTSGKRALKQRRGKRNFRGVWSVLHEEKIGTDAERFCICQ